MGKKLCLNKEKTIRPKFSIFDPSTSNVGDSLISGSLVKIALSIHIFLRYVDRLCDFG